MAFSFKILDDCLWSSDVYAVKIIISDPWLRFVSVALPSDLWTPLQGPPGSLINLLIMYLCKINTFDKNSIWDYLKRVDNVAPYSDANSLTQTESKSTSQLLQSKLNRMVNTACDPFEKAELMYRCGKSYKEEMFLEVVPQ